MMVDAKHFRFVGQVGKSIYSCIRGSMFDLPTPLIACTACVIWFRSFLRAWGTNSLTCTCAVVKDMGCQCLSFSLSGPKGFSFFRILAYFKWQKMLLYNIYNRVGRMLQLSAESDKVPHDVHEECSWHYRKRSDFSWARNTITSIVTIRDCVLVTAQWLDIW